MAKFMFPLCPLRHEWQASREMSEVDVLLDIQGSVCGILNRKRLLHANEKFVD